MAVRRDSRHGSDASSILGVLVKRGGGRGEGKRERERGREGEREGERE